MKEIHPDLAAKITEAINHILEITKFMDIAAKETKKGFVFEVDGQPIPLLLKDDNTKESMKQALTDRAYQLSCLSTLWYRGFPIASFDAIEDKLKPWVEQLVKNSVPQLD